MEYKCYKTTWGDGVKEYYMPLNDTCHACASNECSGMYKWTLYAQCCLPARFDLLRSANVMVEEVSRLEVLVVVGSIPTGEG